MDGIDQGQGPNLSKGPAEIWRGMLVLGGSAAGGEMNRWRDSLDGAVWNLNLTMPAPTLSFPVTGNQFSPFLLKTFPPLYIRILCLQCGRLDFSPWVGKIPWRREQLPTPVFLLGEFLGQRRLPGYSPRDHRVRHDWATATTRVYKNSIHFKGQACILNGVIYVDYWGHTVNASSGLVVSIILSPNVPLPTVLPGELRRITPSLFCHTSTQI